MNAALFAAANASIQDAPTIGTAMKTLSARIRGSKTELEELGESAEDCANGISKYRDEIKALTNIDGTGGFDIMADAAGTAYKDIYDIFVGLAEVWNQLDDTTQSRLAEILGGTRQLSVVAGTIQNIAAAMGAYSAAMDAAGVATSANEKYIDSIQGKLGQLQSTFQIMSADFIRSDTVKSAVDLATGIVKIADSLAKVNVLLPVTLSLFTAIKSVGMTRH